MEIFKSLSERYSKSSRNITTVSLLYLINSYFNTYTQVSLSPDDKPSTYSTISPEPIHESPKGMISKPDLDVSAIFNIL